MSLPSPGVLLRAAELAITNEQPIYLDYFSDSVSKACCIGIRDDNSKNLVKTDSEYTSCIQNIAKCEDCYIVRTENSIYIVSSSIPVKKILSSTSTE